MAAKHFSPVFLAIISIFLVLLVAESQAKPTPGDLCKATEYKALCRSTLKGISDPKKAIEASIKYAIKRLKQSSFLVKKLGGDSDCKEMYDDAISDLQECFNNLREGDKPTLNTNLSAAISSLSTCDDQVSGKNKSLPKLNAVIQHLVDNTLALVTLMRDR